jgi:hypothetical protein
LVEEGERERRRGGIVSITTGVARGVHGNGVRLGNGGGGVVACPDQRKEKAPWASDGPMGQWARVLLGWRGMERWKGGGGIVSIATGVARGVHGSGVRLGNGGGSVVACPD